MINYEALLNRMIDSHQVTQLLGYGGMGAVFKAYDHQFHRWVALKIINPRLLMQPDSIQQFRLEAEAATGLNHYNIAQLYYIGAYQNVPYYTMEFIEGKSFADILKEKGRISGMSCMNYLYQICDGLEYCQYNGVIHRDIKPANLMINKDGIVKVVDFGLAMILQEGSRSQEAEQILGTPKYISPEAGTTRILDHRSDIYSLGATFYHMMAGEPPFNAPTPMELLDKHIKEPLIPLCQKNALVPEMVSDIITKMMEKNPKHRYQSYKELKEDIEKAKASGFKKTKEVKIAEVPGKENLEGKKTVPPFLFVIAGAVIVIIAVLFALKGSSGGGQSDNPKPESGGLDFDKLKTRTQSKPPRGWSYNNPPIPVPYGGGIQTITNAQRAQALNQMQQILMSAHQYYELRQQWPASVSEIKKEMSIYELSEYDPWGNLYQLVFNDADIRVVSPGPDTVYGTRDDIEL